MCRTIFVKNNSEFFFYPPISFLEIALPFLVYINCDSYLHIWIKDMSLLYSIEMFEVLKFFDYEDLNELRTVSKKLKDIIEDLGPKHFALKYLHSLRIEAPRLSRKWKNRVTLSIMQQKCDWDGEIFYHEHHYFYLAQKEPMRIMKNM